MQNARSADKTVDSADDKPQQTAVDAADGKQQCYKTLIRIDNFSDSNKMSDVHLDSEIKLKHCHTSIYMYFHPQGILTSVTPFRLSAIQFR